MGGAGIFSLIWKIIVALWVLSMVIDAYNIYWFTLPGLLISMIVLDFVLWCITVFWWAPRFQVRVVTGYERAMYPVSRGEGGYNPETEESTVIDKNIDYPRLIYRDLQHNQDQGMLQASLIANLFVLIFLAIFLGQNGQSTFQPIPAVFINADIMNYVIAKAFQLMVLGVVAVAIALMSNCLPSFLWRHMTAIGKDYEARTGNEMVLGNKMGSKKVSLIGVNKTK